MLIKLNREQDSTICNLLMSELQGFSIFVDEDRHEGDSVALDCLHEIAFGQKSRFILMYNGSLGNRMYARYIQPEDCQIWSLFVSSYEMLEVLAALSETAMVLNLGQEVYNAGLTHIKPITQQCVEMYDTLLNYVVGE